MSLGAMFSGGVTLVPSRTLGALEGGGLTVVPSRTLGALEGNQVIVAAGVYGESPSGPLVGENTASGVVRGEFFA